VKGKNIKKGVTTTEVEARKEQVSERKNSYQGGLREAIQGGKKQKTERRGVEKNPGGKVSHQNRCQHCESGPLQTRKETLA